MVKYFQRDASVKRVLSYEVTKKARDDTKLRLQYFRYRRFACLHIVSGYNYVIISGLDPHSTVFMPALMAYQNYYQVYTRSPIVSFRYWIHIE